MKNIHILPTENSSRLLYNFTLKSFCIQKEKDGMFINDGNVSGADFWSIEKANNNGFRYVNIYITSDEEIKEGDYFWKPDCNMIFKAEYTPHKGCQKVILTTDQDLIKDGVQAIDDEFLEWFVKNPSCEEVEIANDLKYFNVDELRERHLKGLPHLYSESIGYKIIIPQEELKQDIEKEMFELEQELDIPSSMRWHNSKPKQERSYSEEDMKEAFNVGFNVGYNDETSPSYLTAEKFIEQFKNK